MENKKMSPGKGTEAKVNTKVLLEVNEVVKTTLRVEQDVLTKEARIVCIRNANHTNEGPISMFSYKSLQNQFNAKLVMPSPIKAMLRDSTLLPKSFAKEVEPSTKHITSVDTDTKKVVSYKASDNQPSAAAETQLKAKRDSAHKWIASVKTADTAQVAADEPKSAPEKVVEALKTITSLPLSKSPTSAFPFSTNRKSLHSFKNTLEKAPQSVSHKTIISLKDTPEVVTVMSPASTQTVQAPFENVQTASIERFKSTIAATRGRQLEPVMLDSYTPTEFKVESNLLENQETSAPSTLEPTLKLEAEDMVLLTNTNQARVAEIHPVALAQYTLKETSPMPVHNVKDLSPNSRMDMNMQKTLLE